MSGFAHYARLGFTIGASGRCQRPGPHMGRRLLHVNITAGDRSDHANALAGCPLAD
jgi:hypothetical protein